MSSGVADQSFMYGRVGFFNIIGGTATATADTATDGTNPFAINCTEFTGKKTVAISQTTGSAGEITYAVYGSYDPLVSETDFIALMDATADTEKIFLIATGAVDSGGTGQAEVETTKPYKWIGCTVVGNTFTYNLYFAGD